ncbi:MAG: phage tail protein [Beijerinckiaceae bacterium]
MSTPYLSEIRIMSFNFPPKGWALCNGQLMPINQNQALFSLLGTTYGGDGRVTFGLPNLQGNVPIHMGNGFVLGQVGGEVNHTLLLNEMPAHNHPMTAMNTAAQTTAGSFAPGPTRFLANAVAEKAGNPATYVAANYYGTGSAATTFGPKSVVNAGGSQPHPNQQPFLVLSFCIALQGIFPSRG